MNTRSVNIAQGFAESNIEVWQIDLADAHFKSRSAEQMRAFTGKYVADIIEAAHKKTGKDVVLLTRSYGAIPVLRGARDWQLRKPSTDYLAGAILFSPDLYSRIPSLGQDPEYVPITSTINIPIMIYQNGSRANRWHLDNISHRLHLGGSDLYIKIIPSVFALLSDSDQNPETMLAVGKLIQEIPKVVKLLGKINTPLNASKLSFTTKAVQIKKTEKSHGISSNNLLKPFRGKLKPLKINLRDVNGNRYQFEDYHNKVTVINFWASWCPGCVKEIPSLNRLKDAMVGMDFELIMINCAEKPDRVRDFLKPFNVKFPSLVDPTGEFAGQWNVVVYPSTFIIGPDGEIYSGVNAVLEWDSPEIIKKLQQLSINNK